MLRGPYTFKGYITQIEIAKIRNSLLIVVSKMLFEMSYFQKIVVQEKILKDIPLPYNKAPHYFIYQAFHVQNGLSLATIKY